MFRLRFLSIKARCFSVGLALCIAWPGVFAFDPDEAEMVARQNGCFKCHGIDKKKYGPAYKTVAAKYRGDPEAQAKLLQHLTSGKVVKFPDGSEEEHKVLKADTAVILNLIDWLLSL